MKWNNIKRLGFGLALIATSQGYAQNNEIFKGGNGDGWSVASYAQSTANIFRGGTGDGWSSLAYSQASSGIFKGGSGDGWSNSNYLQNTTNIFAGGNGDGWSWANYVQTTPNIFTGGNGDGWSNANHEQSTGNIYKGGGGDGWASSYVPQTPLPVTFIYFTAQKQGNNAAVLQWKTGTQVNASHFVVERSTDAVNFEAIGQVLVTGGNAATSYSFTDNRPLKGLNYYRLRQVDKDSKFALTPSKLLKFDAPAAGIVKYYPNPTNGMLNIKITASMQSEAIVINVSNVSGAVLNQLKVGAGASSIIPVSLAGYAKGVYFVQVKTSTVNSTQRVVLQ